MANYAASAMQAINDPEAQATKGQYVEKALHNILTCPECKEFPPNLVEEFSAGDMVCGSCGLVLSHHIIDTRSEWRTFANDDQNHDDPNRVGDSLNPLLNGSQLETSIGGQESGRAARDLNRTQSKATESRGNKGLLQAYKDIQSHCDSINTGKKVSDTAKHIFKLVDDARLLKGKSQEAVIAGCIFIACRQCDVHRTFRDIYNLTHVSKKEIGRVFKTLEAFLQKQKLKDPSSANFITSAAGYQNTVTTGAVDLCGRYCSQLGFLNPMKVERISRELVKKSSSVSDLAGRSPLSVAASCIYMASILVGEPKTTKAIAKVAGVSDGTVKTVYKLLYAAKDQVIDADVKKIGGTSVDSLPPT